MAAINIVSTQILKTPMFSGEGTPDFESKEYARYYDRLTGIEYYNPSGASDGWLEVISLSALSGYTMTEIDNNFLSASTSIGDLDGYTTTQIDNLLTAVTIDMSPYFTSGETIDNFLSASTTVNDLNGYTTTEVDSNFLSANTSFYTQSEVDSNFLSASTTITDLSGYTTTEVNNNFLSANTNPGGNDGEIQYNDNDSLGASTELFWDKSNSALTVGDPSTYSAKFSVKSDDSKTVIAEFMDDTETAIFEIYQDGSIRLYETSETIIDNGSIWLDTNSNYLKLLKDSVEYYLNIDQFQDQRDIQWTAPQNGDIMVWNADSGYGYNQHTEDFDLILYSTQVNISYDTQLNFDVPAGYKITSCIIEEIAGYDAGDISIGISVSGYSVVYYTTVEANDTVDCLISKEFFSSVNDTELYIMSNLWGSGVVNIYVKFEKAIE